MTGRLKAFGSDLVVKFQQCRYTGIDAVDGVFAFGVLQRCDGVDLDALDAFVAVYAEEEPAVPGADATPRAG